MHRCITIVFGFNPTSTPYIPMLSTDNEADKIFELTIEEEERMRGGVGVSVGGG